jgi:hypothetical protein
VGIYQFLAGQLPLFVPSLIAASPSGDWLLLEAVPPTREAGRWGEQDYVTAIDNLAQLHDRFWGLGEDLNAFPWLSRPLQADFDVHVAAAAHAVERIRYRGEPQALARVPERMELLSRLTSDAERVVRPLRREPNTLLHGDYWPGNISVMRDGSQIVYDWQLTAIGPAILDVVVFMKKTEWWFESTPVSEEELAHRYRDALSSRINVTWKDDAWSLLWDHALMWRFMQEWMDLLAASPNTVLLTRAEQLDQVWLKPVLEVTNRRLGDPS